MCAKLVQPDAKQHTCEHYETREKLGDGGMSRLFVHSLEMLDMNLGSRT